MTATERSRVHGSPVLGAGILVRSVANPIDPPNPSARARRPAAAAFALVAAVGDPEGTRAVTAIVALLVVLGILLVMVAVWLFRTTRPDPELLAPLEVMGDRSWRRGDPVWQRRRLDEVRPEGAEPLQPSAAPPELDEAFDLGPVASGFDDLHDDVDREQPVASPAAPSNEPAPPPPADPTAPVVRGPVVRISTEPPVQTELPLEPSGQPIDPLLAARHDDDAARTPTGIARPVPDDLPDHDVDPALLAAAMAELDAELAASRRPERDADAG